VRFEGSHPFRKVREMDGAPELKLSAVKLAMLATAWV